MIKDVKGISHFPGVTAEALERTRVSQIRGPGLEPHPVFSISLQLGSGQTRVIHRGGLSHGGMALTDLPSLSPSSGVATLIDEI